MRRFLSVAIFSSMLAIVACNPCYNVECDAPDVNRINGLSFQFDLDAFAWNEVDNAMVIRYQKGTLNALDTVFLVEQFASGDSSILISQGYPFATTDDFTQFSYTVYNNSREYAYSITNIVTNGYYPTDCCCCYRNKQRTFMLNSVSLDQSGNQDPVLLGK